jgi:hypothetical protein
MGGTRSTLGQKDKFIRDFGGETRRQRRVCVCVCVCVRQRGLEAGKNYGEPTFPKGARDPGQGPTMPLDIITVCPPVTSRQPSRRSTVSAQTAGLSALAGRSNPLLAAGRICPKAATQPAPFLPLANISRAL